MIGFVRIMMVDCINDCNMLLIVNVVMFVQSLISYGWMCGDQLVEQGNVDCYEDWVIWDFCQYVVEINV